MPNEGEQKVNFGLKDSVESSITLQVSDRCSAPRLLRGKNRLCLDHVRRTYAERNDFDSIIGTSGLNVE